MIQTLLRYMKGYVKIRVSGCSPERFLNLCRYHGIYLWGLNPVGTAYEMYVTLNGFRKIRPIVRKTQVRIKLVKRYGFPFLLHKYRKRTLFVPGILVCMILLTIYSSCIWDIHFEGNEKWTDEVLLEFLETTNVHPAMGKHQVDCAQIVRDIRKTYDDIVWVSASIDGCCLKIQIKENEDTFREENKKSDTSQEQNENQEQNVNQQQDTDKEPMEDRQDTPVDLVAEQDGIITDIITRNGVPQVHIGDEVKKGDVLVSGRVEVLNDAQEVIGYQYQHSDADIFADTQMEYREEVSVTYRKKRYDKKKQRYLFQLQIGKYRLMFGTQKHSFSQWEKHTLETQIKLGENFYLPVSYGVTVIKGYDTTVEKYTKKQIQRQLSRKFKRFSEELEEKGIQIRENSVKIHLNGNSASAMGTLYLNQKIGREADTEILEIERNKSDEFIGTDD